MTHVHLLLLLSSAVAGLVAPARALAGPPTASTAQASEVTVQLVSGREFRGQIDPRSGNEQLWLRCKYGNAVVLRPIDWKQISSAVLGVETLNTERFRERAQQVKRPTSREIWPASSDRSITPVEFVASGPVALDRRSALALGSVPLVRSLTASAQLANWDADADADGLALVVQPLSCDGAILPVGGIVDATLFGYERRSGMPPEHWSQLAHWSQPVSLTCYGPEGAMLRLPMERSLIELPRSEAPRRILRVRLTAPGHGTYETEIPFLAARRLP